MIYSGKSIFWPQKFVLGCPRRQVPFCFKLCGRDWGPEAFQAFTRDANGNAIISYGIMVDGRQKKEGGEEYDGKLRCDG